MKNPAPHRASFVAGLAVAAALVGGTIAAKQLIESGAAVRTETASDRYGSLQQSARQKGGALVPFLGPFAYHTKGVTECGPAVRLMEGALRQVRPRIRTDKARNCVGPSTKRQIQEFQRRLHYKPTGVYTLLVHQRLVSQFKAYDNDARRDLLYLVKQRRAAKQRATVLLVVGHARLVAGCCLRYSQSSSRSYFPPWPRLPPGTDCSGFATWVAWQSGFGPAVGYYGPGSPVGWTGTLSQQGVRVPPNAPLKVGDLVFYGYGPPWGDVKIYIGHGNITGHGSTGVNVRPINYRPIGEVRRYITG